MFEISLVIAVVLALTEFTKRMAFVPAKYLPAVSLFLGFAAGLFYVDAPDFRSKVMYGLMIGLSASGLFDQTKIVTKGDGK